MANYTATTDMTLEAAITAGSMANGENLTILAGVTVTCTETPSVLMGNVIVYGTLLVDGVNISSGNMINFVLENGGGNIDVKPGGSFEVDGDWYSIGTTDGTDAQSISTSSYWGSFCVDFIPMAQVETGRRIDYDSSSGSLPEAGDWITKDSDATVMGKIVEVNDTSSYIVVQFLTGSLANNDSIHVQKVVENNGPDMQKSWTALVNNASGDILESGIYQQFGNVRANNNSYIGSFHRGVGGFAYENTFQAESITMGSTGTTGGFVAPSGCDIRVPNVHFTIATTTTYASGLVTTPSSTFTSRTGVDTSQGGRVDISICNIGSAIMYSSNANQFDASYVGATIGIGSTNSPYQFSYNNCVVVCDPQSTTTNSYAFACNSSSGGVRVVDCMVLSPLSDNMFFCLDSPNLFVSGLISSSLGDGTYQESLIKVDLSPGSTICDSAFVGSNTQDLIHLYITRSSDCLIENVRLCGCQDRVTRAVTNAWGVYLQASHDSTIRGIFVMDNCPTPDSLIDLRETNNTKIRCAGTLEDPIDLQSTIALFLEIYTYQSSLTGIDMARCWVTGNTTNSALLTSYQMLDTSIVNCSGNYACPVSFASKGDLKIRGLHSGSTSIGGYNSYHNIGSSLSGSYGRQVHDIFRSDTVGTIGANFIPPSEAIDNITIIAGTPTFLNNGYLSLKDGDILEIEQDYYARGHSAFSGGFTTIRGNGSWEVDEMTSTDIYFQYDVGSGYNGTWLDIRTASNLTGITDMADGVKLKFRLEATGSYTDCWYIGLSTTTSLEIQANNLYPIDQDFVEVKVTAKSAADASLIEGARVYLVADAGGPLTEGTVLFNDMTNSLGLIKDTEFLFSSNQPVIGRIRKGSESPFFKSTPVSGTITSSGLDITGFMVPDE